MAKLDKSQQAYAMKRIDEMASMASNKVKYKIPVTSLDELKDLLTKKGFTVRDGYNITSYISVTKTPAQKAADDKARAAADDKVEAIYSEAQSAKDQVMLGDSEEITTVLAALAKKLGV